MFVNQAPLSHVLRPECYFRPEQYELEIARLFEPAWHVVGSVDELKRDGDFLTLELFGTPLLVRNFAGTIRTFLNVCTHRHSLLTHVERGNSPKLVCQYHGWEYQADGRTGRIPDAQSFKPLPDGPECLKSFRTEVRGPLVLVAWKEPAIPLDEQLLAAEEVLQEFPASRWKQVAAWKSSFAANWKVVVENTVESYHVPMIHPKTLGHFGREEATEHRILPQGTVMKSPIVAPKFYFPLATWLLSLLESGCQHRHQLYHAFPNLLLVRIDAMLQVMTVIPTGPEACELSVRLLILRGVRESWRSRWLTWAWGRFKTLIIRQILAEDAAIYPDLQRGLKASPFRGTISTREELVHAFQDYVRQGCGLNSSDASGGPG